jgi:hypothetical protein
MAASQGGGGDVYGAPTLTGETSPPEGETSTNEAMAGAIAEFSTVPAKASSLGSLRSATSPARSAGEVHNLVRDCLLLWNIGARIMPTGDAVTIHTSDGTFTLSPALTDARPVRWFLQTPTRAASNRAPRALPSIVAALSALRTALGGDSSSTLRIGTGRTSA